LWVVGFVELLLGKRFGHRSFNRIRIDNEARIYD
jgi:hypothetical protein